jgi:hypothetical protein
MIDDGAWTAIKCTNAIFGDAQQRRISDDRQDQRLAVDTPGAGTFAGLFCGHTRGSLS